MIGHVFFRAKMCQALDAVHIATCDREIADYARSIGARVVMTKDTHERCTDRVAEAVDVIERASGIPADIVVILQGDEPMVTPGMIEASLAPMQSDASVEIVNLMTPLSSEAEHDDWNEPKVVVDRQGNALYFSREAIPSRWKRGTNVPMMKQVCVMPFRRRALAEFTALSPTPLEVAESIDMLRWLEHGKTVRMVLSPTAPTYSVDTPEDLECVRDCLRHDPLVQRYGAVFLAEATIQTSSVETCV